MTSISDTISVGDPLPRIASVRAGGGLDVSVTWASGLRAGRTETIDLAPVVMRMRFFRPLRDNPALFASVTISDGGSALTWGSGEIDMAAQTVERLARLVKSPEEFRAFLTRHHLTLDAAAAILGISRRQAAYFAKSKPLPRLVSLACAGYEASLAT